MKMSDSLVIIPTYNEKENVVKMLETVMSLEPLLMFLSLMTEVLMEPLTLSNLWLQNLMGEFSSSNVMGSKD